MKKENETTLLENTIRRYNEGKVNLVVRCKQHRNILAKVPVQDATDEDIVRYLKIFEEQKDPQYKVSFHVIKLEYEKRNISNIPRG